MSEKTPNYTEAQTSELVEAYEAAQDEESRAQVVERFADEFGKTVRSIRAKLVREGVYIAKTYKGKTGEKPETKEAIVEDIARTMGVDAESKLGGLQKANKQTLSLLRKTLLITQSELLNSDN